ncbi:MAG: ATP-dependent RecD-like DNA helicase [Chlamydiia bacterium]|nr:ATP-dependent RecD-like DNA helicase [Chlamydiia bacterium]
MDRTKEASDVLSGRIDHIVFTSEETGFTVAKIGKSTQVVGKFSSISPGEVITCKGRWVHHPKHGRQFEVATYELKKPEDVVGIQKYLESGLIKGIGPVYAKRIVEQFGPSTLDIIENASERLHEVEGLGKKRIGLIIESFNSQKSIRNVMIFLQSHGVGTALAQKIYRRYGEESVRILKEDPYRVARELTGVGFLTADQIAHKLGFEANSPQRIAAGIEYVLKGLSEEGHTCYPEAELIDEVEKILYIDRGLCQQGLLALEAEGRIIRESLPTTTDDPLYVWLKPFYLGERGISREVQRLMTANCAFREVEVDKALVWVENEMGLKLAKEQKDGIRSSISEKMHILTGGPGTGKSTITKAILKIHSKLSKDLVLAAPTGRAAKRMQEITRKNAQTIHSLLEFDFTTNRFKKNADAPIECDLIIIDEASMIDTYLMYSLLRAIPSRTRVILIGDIDQLPSVGPGNVLRDLIESKKIPTTRLYRIFRQGKNSRITLNAHNINRGLFPDVTPLPDSDFEFFPFETPEEILDKIVKLNRSDLPKALKLDPLKDIQVLSPMKRGVIGCENLNLHLQKALVRTNIPPLVRMGRQFLIGDKLMQIRNNYSKGVYNGDIGFLIDIHPEDGTLAVQFDKREVEYDISELDELMHAFAVSIHKYQGSECKCIIMPIHTTHYKLLHRNLLYTGITRGKKHVALLGTKKAIHLAIQNNEVKKRETGLYFFMTQSP